MAHKKGQSSSKNGRESQSKRLGLKKFGGEVVKAGNIIVRQRGTVHNPDKNLQSRKLVGVNILSGLTKKKDKWEGGKIYNPKNGKTYKCSIWLDGNNLKVRGYLAMFYETQTWTRK